MGQSSEVIAGYIPVLHSGYMDAFSNHPDAEIGVFDRDIISQFDYLRKDIRALEPEVVSRLLEGIGKKSRLIGGVALDALLENPRAVLFDDDVSRQLLTSHPNSRVGLEPVFLRWDRENSDVNVPVTADRIVTLADNDQLVTALYEEARKSSNWWRHVAAAVVEESKIVHAHHNSSVPTEFSSAIDSDPRITAKRGESIELSIDIHAEARLIASLAREGESSKDRDIFVTTFPCQNCAKLIAECGFRSCYFIEGYATLDGQNVLKSAGVELVKIETSIPKTDPRRLRVYPSN